MMSNHDHHPHLLRGIVLIMLAVFLFSSMDTLAKYILKSYPLPPLIWARYAVHTAFMLALLAVNWQRIRQRTDAAERAPMHRLPQESR